MFEISFYMKKALFSTTCTVILALLFFGSAFALPADLCDIYDVESDYTLFLLPDNRGSEKPYMLGTQSFKAYDDRAFFLGGAMEFLKGVDSCVTGKIADLSLSSEFSFCTCNGSAACIEHMFGLRLATLQKNCSTCSALNHEDYGHTMIFNTIGNLLLHLPAADTAGAIEDLSMDVGQIFQGMVICIDDAIPAPVSEPLTIILLGGCLLGLSLLRRKSH